MRLKLPIGPGALVAAAFIGPGTVTACTVAGASFGYALVWTLVFATFATIILQEMSARLGLAAGMGLGAALVHPSNGMVFRCIAILLSVSALAVGNAAYEAGNLAGGALGIEAVTGSFESPKNIVVLGLSLLAGLFLYFGKYSHIEKLLIGLVLLMSLAFAGSVIITRPDFGAFLAGLKPSIPDTGLFTAVALIGTTIVPYNLFLHSSSVREKWLGDTGAAIKEARRDTGLSIGLGGLISILALTTAAASLYGSGLTINSARDMAMAIEPSYGPVARYMVGAGLFAAGLSSSITAPLATAYAMSEIMKVKRNGAGFRLIALAVLLIGTLVAISGVRPVSVIMFAQIANGLLLPVLASFLLILMNRKALLGAHANRLPANLIGSFVVIICFGLGLRLVLRALNIWP
ncbi:Nramp family divalent metal transporter [Hyphomonas pacifica]|uniref:Uncharacterized protein n=1 Tax=Hyphomonas pacifica TaxID=1280941 RepID=A0A062U2D4_9PROT|nr:Nramp family divalent metal transporter [Hyphomonas pacifica]KCZ50769.1 hypothetical protein HY2_02635 [Hyphomonas pacifica]RAN34474.1 hypothetical protein HY3_10905 [Hyphomonas pacifica]RAN34987.1 hypothetical protein HY11_03035 [Hyphomonas pacifica]